MKNRSGKPVFVLTFFLILLAGLNQAVTAAVAEQVVTISMPAEVLRQTISDALPIPIAAKSQYMEGSIVVDSLENLQVRDKSIFLQGVVAGRDLTMNADLGGQHLIMKLGNVRLPVSCELFLRFDRQQKVLFVKPVFAKGAKTKGGDAVDLQPLLASLGEKEYPVKFDDLAPYLFKMGARTIAVQLIPADIQTSRDMLLVRMIPKVDKPR